MQDFEALYPPVQLAAGEGGRRQSHPERAGRFQFSMKRGLAVFSNIYRPTPSFRNYDQAYPAFWDRRSPTVFPLMVTNVTILEERQHMSKPVMVFGFWKMEV